MTADRKLLASSTPSPLPGELCAEIFNHVRDPYDLWVSCRQVSHTFKHEAERAFCRIHLPRMRIQYKIKGSSAQTSHHSCRMRLKLDENDATIKQPFVRFHLGTSHWQFNANWRSHPRTFRWKNFGSEDQRNRMIQAAVDRDDVNALSRIEMDASVPNFSHKMHIWFEPAESETPSSWRYANDVEIPNMTLHLNNYTLQTTPTPFRSWMDEGHATLDWKALLTTLFSEEAYVRRKLAQVGIPIVLPARLGILLDPFMAAIPEHCPTLARSESGSNIHQQDRPIYESLRERFIQSVIIEYGSHHTRLYEEAYDARLRRAYARSGHRTAPEDANASYTDIGKYYTLIATHVRLMQEFRNNNIRKSAERYWQSKVGVVEFRGDLHGAYHVWQVGNPQPQII